MIFEFECVVVYFLNFLVFEFNVVVVGLFVDIMWIDIKFKDDVNVDMNEFFKFLKIKRNCRVEKMNFEVVFERLLSFWEDLEVDVFVFGLYIFGKNFV